MVKAALLYADKTKLCSANYSTWMPELANKNITVDQLLNQAYEIEEMIPYMFSDPREIDYNHWVSKQAINTLKSKNPTEKDLKFIAESKQLALQQYEDLKRRFPKLDLEKTNEEFETAVKANLLEIHAFKINESENIGASKLKGTLDESNRKISKEFVDVILETVTNSSTYPLFDDGAGELINLAIRVGELNPNQTRKAQAKQSKLAAEVLQKLPVFDEASVNEIIDVRKELERPLLRFRSAIINYSDKIKSESWSEEFLVEAEEAFHREIEPAVLDIEDIVKSSSSLLALTTRKLVDKPAITTYGASVFSYVVSQQTLLPEIAKVAMAVGGIGIGGATAIYDAYKEHQKQSQTIEKNQLYFYYKAGKLLSR